MDVVNRSQDLSSISFISGSMAGRTFPISKSVITIGREPKNDIVLSDQTVSREHARLVNNNGQWSIEKLAPTNTITVNKREVQSSPINDRDEISLGGVITFLFHAASSPSSDRYGAVAAPPSYNQPGVPQQSFAQPSFPARPQSQPLPPQQSFAQSPFPPQSPPYASSPSYPPVGGQVPGA